MSFSATINLGTVGDSILDESVSISGCTGINSSNECTGCTIVSMSQLVSSFPKIIEGFENNHNYVYVEVISGNCTGESQCMVIGGKITTTPTPVPTATPTSTPVPTSTPIPTSTPVPTTEPTSTPVPTSTPTNTPIPPTVTPTPTATNTPTPTPTQVQGCLFVSYSGTSGTSTCLGNSYPYNTEAVIFQLTDGNGNPVNTPTLITIELDTISRPCGSSSFEQVVTLYINPGENTTQYNYTSGQYVECGFSECVLESEEYIGVRSVSGGYTLCETTVTPTPTVTNTPTVTPTQAPGSCYKYQVESYVTQSNYGVRYTPPGQGSRDERFSEMLNVSPIDYSEFFICSTVDPTLLDYTGGSPVGIGQVNGITRTGPNGSCNDFSDCTNPEPTPTPTLDPETTPDPTLDPTNEPFQYFCNYGQGCVGQSTPCPQGSIDCGFGFDDGN